MLRQLEVRIRCASVAPDRVIDHITPARSRTSDRNRAGSGLCHNIGIHVYRVNGVTYRDLIVQAEDLLNIATVTFCSVGYKNLVRCNIAASCLIIIFGDRIAQELIAKVGSVTMKSLRFSHLIHRTVQCINDSRCQRLRHISDSQTDDLLIRVCCGIRIYLFTDGGK